MTPAVVGSVSTLMYGSLLRPWYASAPQVLAMLHQAEHPFIHARPAACGNDVINGSAFSVAFSMSRRQLLAHTEPIEPPRKVKVHHAHPKPVFRRSFQCP